MKTYSPISLHKKIYGYRAKKVTYEDTEQYIKKLKF